MNSKGTKQLVLVILTVAFTLALTFITLEIPKILNIILRNYFPDIYWEPESIQVLMNYARPIGYVCLVLVIALIFVGLLTKRERLSSFGSFIFFLPTFGYFAASMFFLTGIGILRVMWLPFWDSDPILLKLANVSYIPYWIILCPFSLLGTARLANMMGHFFAYVAVGAGLLVFCIGSFTWFYGKMENKRVFDFWIYKYSRHPQYLGFILWSYGVMILTTLAPVPFGGSQPCPSLPWLISTILVVCVALREEIMMIKQANEGYLGYRWTAPFMLPLPSFLSNIITAPNQFILKKIYPESGREVLLTFLVYCTILISISSLILVLGWV